MMMMMNSPCFDEHGYPTEHTEKAIRDWPIERAAELPAYMATAWNRTYGRVEETQPGLWVFATGGWSGNESVLSAAHESIAWAVLAWQSVYLAGGLLIVAVSKAAQAALDTQEAALTAWAWGATRSRDGQR